MNPSDARAAVVGVLIFVFGIIWTIGITWWMSRPDRFEPPSEITSACAISHDVSEFFERRRHLLHLRRFAVDERLREIEVVVGGRGVDFEGEGSVACWNESTGDGIFDARRSAF